MNRSPALPKTSLSLMEKAELVRRATSRHDARGALRARVILMLADGVTWSAIIHRTGCSRGFVARWAARFNDYRVPGLTARHHSHKPLRMTRKLEIRIVRAAGHRTAAGAPRWSTRSLGEALGLSHMTVHRVWQKHGLDPAGRTQQRKTWRQGRAGA